MNELDRFAHDEFMRPHWRDRYRYYRRWGIGVFEAMWRAL